MASNTEWAATANLEGCFAAKPASNPCSTSPDDLEARGPGGRINTEKHKLDLRYDGGASVANSRVSTGTTITTQGGMSAGPMYWEMIADQLARDGWTRGCFAYLDGNGRTMHSADAHRDDGRRFFVQAQGAVFLELAVMETRTSA